MCDKFPKYNTEILLVDFNVKVGREDIFKPTIGNKCLHEISNDNGVTAVNFNIFHFGVLHPVARTLSRLLEEPSLATTTRYSRGNTGYTSTTVEGDIERSFRKNYAQCYAFNIYIF
jgi:hypothetical protein